MCSETKSLLPTAKDSCRPSVIVIDGSTQSNGCLPGPSSSWKNQPCCSYIGTPEVLELEREPKRRARARSEVEVSGKLTAFFDHMDSASQQRLDEAFATFFFQTAIPFHIADCSSLRHLLSLARPAYKVPSRKLLATRLLDNAFEKQKTVIGECIAKSNVVALISDKQVSLFANAAIEALLQKEADFARMMMEESLSDSSDESQNECDSDNDVMINDT